MSETVSLICRINSTAAEPERSEYQLQKPKKLSSTLLRERKLSVIVPVHPRSKLVAASFKPLTKGFVDDTIFTDSDMLRLKASILRKTDIYEFDRIIGSNISNQDASKKLFETSLKKGTEELFNGKSTVMALLGSSNSAGKEEVFKGQGGLLELTARNILGLLKLKKTHDEENDHRLEVTLTALIDGGVFDLGEQKTVTNFRKTNHHEPSVIHIRHEEEFRSLMYLAENNLRGLERKLEIKSKEVMHIVGKFMLKRNGRILGDICLVRTCSLLRMPKQDLNSLLFLVEDDKDYLEDASQNGFLRELLNQRTLRPNFLQVVFFVSCSPKLYEQSTATLRVAEEFCERTGKASYAAQKENEEWSRHASHTKCFGGRENSVMSRKPLISGSTSRKMYNSNTKRNSDVQSIDKASQSKEKIIERKNRELEDRLQKIDADLADKEETDFQERKLEFIEKEIEYRRKLKRYKDKICRLEGLVKTKTNDESRMTNSRMSKADPYKDQFEQLFEENLMLKEENSVLREKLDGAPRDTGSTRTSRSQAKLESQLAKMSRQKTLLETKIKTMEAQIRELISDEERDIQRLNRKGNSAQQSF